MLRVARSVREIDVPALMAVYSVENANYRIEQQFYLDLLSFFEADEARYALWEVDGVYCAALRLEPFEDGFLIAGLQTHPSMRNRGLASLLLSAVVNESEKRLYSHVERKNKASMRVHRKCGFSVLLDYARYLDGSVSGNAVTMCTK